MVSHRQELSAPQLNQCDCARVKDWKCTNCGDPIWIATQINGKKYVLERIKAKEIQKDDVILLDGMHLMNDN